MVPCGGLAQLHMHIVMQCTVKSKNLTGNLMILSALVIDHLFGIDTVVITIVYGTCGHCMGHSIGPNLPSMGRINSVSVPQTLKPPMHVLPSYLT